MADGWCEGLVLYIGLFDALKMAEAEGATMWARKRIDIGWSDLLFGVWRTCLSPNRTRAAQRVEALWPDAEHTLVCLSVRSGFDLLLAALDLPRDSEV